MSRSITPNQKPRIRYRRHSHRGSALLEAAFVMWILISLAFGTAEYGYFFFLKHSLQGATREGGRRAILATAKNSDVISAVATSLNAAGLNSSTQTLDSKYSLLFSPTDISTATPGQSVTITLQTTWGAAGVHALPVALGGIRDTKAVIAKTAMRREQ